MVTAATLFLLLCFFSHASAFLPPPQQSNAPDPSLYLPPPMSRPKHTYLSPYTSTPPPLQHPITATHGGDPSSLLLHFPPLSSYPKPIFPPFPPPSTSTQPLSQNPTAAGQSSPPVSHSAPITPPIMPPTTASPVSQPQPPPTVTAPPPTSSSITQEQLTNILEALVGAGGDFSSWSNIISSVAATLPLSATIFIPADDSFFPTSIDPYIFPYHIVPQRLDFSELRLLPPHSRLPTLVPEKTILVTSNSGKNFTLDDTLLTHPDLYTTPTVAVHGISTLLDYKKYGEDVPPPPRRSRAAHHRRQDPSYPVPPPQAESSNIVPIPGTMMPRGEVIGGKRSDASSFCCDTYFVSVLCGAVLLIS